MACYETMPMRSKMRDTRTSYRKRKDSDDSADEAEWDAGVNKKRVFDLRSVQLKANYDQIAPGFGEIVPETPECSQDQGYAPATPVQCSNPPARFSRSPESSPPLEDPRTMEEWRKAVLSTGKDAITVALEEHYDKAMHAIHSMLGPDVDPDDYLLHVAKAGFTKEDAPPPKGCMFEGEFKERLYTLFPAFMDGREKDAGSKVLDFLLNTKVFPKKRFAKPACHKVSPLFKEMPMNEVIRVAIYLLARIAEADVKSVL